MAMKKKNQNSKKESPMGKWAFIIGVLLGLWVLSMIIAAFINSYYDYSSDVVPSVSKGNVAVIKISGEISDEDSGSIWQAGGASAQRIKEYIRKAEEDQAIKAVVFAINSPGGSPVASEEIMNAIRGMEKYNVAVIKDLGASGAYWAASATDRIVASRLSLTGSVGVYSSYMQFEGLMKKYGVGYERLVGGEYKDIGSPFRNMTPEEKAIFQSKIDKIHAYFLDSVAENRNLDEAQKKIVGQGLFFTGEEALELGLVDEIGGMETAEQAISAQLNITVKSVEYRERQSFIGSLLNAMSNPSYAIGRGIGDSIAKSQLEAAGPGIRT